MSYTIYHADGQLVTVPDNAIDTTFYNATPAGVWPPDFGIGTQLVGRNAINYGTSVAQNFLQMTENFASEAASRPTDSFALQGQLWFEKDAVTPEATGKLFVRMANAPSGDTLNWNKVVTEDTSGNITVTGHYIGNGSGLTNIPTSALSTGTITVTGGTGLGVAGSPVALGGTIALSNTGVTSIVAGAGISISGATGAVTITNTGGSSSAPHVYTSAPAPGVAVTGDILVVGSVISIYAASAWQQIFPAVYS
jgi:hypothetical protein